jgi:hypothetical protein
MGGILLALNAPLLWSQRMISWMWIIPAVIVGAVIGAVALDCLGAILSDVADDLDDAELSHREIDD